MKDFQIGSISTLFFNNYLMKTDITRKYPLRRYIHVVLTHTTTWDRHWVGDETLRRDFSLLTLTKKLLLVAYCNLTAETEVSFGTDGQKRKDRQMWKSK